MIAEKAALLSTNPDDEEIPRLTSDQGQVSPLEERDRDSALSTITPGESHSDPLMSTNGMSEKARGKMRAVEADGEDDGGVVDIGDEELLGIAAAGVGPSGYVPTQEWVSSWQKGYVCSPISLCLFHSHIRIILNLYFPLL